LGFKNSYEMLFKIRKDYTINLKPKSLLASHELGIIKNED
jgi:hypothetical protein